MLKQMHYDNGIPKVLSFIFGLTGGGITYPKIHLMFDPSLWGTIQERAISLFYTLLVAFLSGAVGYAGGILMKKMINRRKKKPSD